MVFWPFFGPKINSFLSDLKNDPSRTESNRAEPPACTQQENRQFYRIIKIRTRPDPTNVLREERKGPIISRFSGGGYYYSVPHTNRTGAINVRREISARLMTILTAI